MENVQKNESNESNEKLARKILIEWKTRGYDSVGYSGEYVYPCHSEEWGNVHNYALFVNHDGTTNIEEFNKAAGFILESMEQGYKYEYPWFEQEGRKLPE